MTLHRFDVIQPSELTGLPEDAIVTTWKFFLVGNLETSYDQIRDALNLFFEDQHDVGGVPQPSIASFMSNSAIALTWQVKAYDLELPPNSPPVYTSTFDVTGLSGTSPLPAEVALVLSFQGPPEVGVAPARLRNRKYLGGFGTDALGSGGRPDSQLITSMRAAARDLWQASDANPDWLWVWHSPTTAAYGTIQDGWIDNAWDTQRRRGLPETARSSWDPTTPAV